MKKLIILFAVFAFATGCAHSQKGPKTASSSEVEKIQKRAAVDLNCAAENVTVEVLQEGGMMTPWTFAAKGCDKSATYLSRMGTILRN
jgi:hypothetical protein